MSPESDVQELSPADQYLKDLEAAARILAVEKAEWRGKAVRAQNEYAKIYEAARMVLHVTKDFKQRQQIALEHLEETLENAPDLSE
ncbi:MAG: hypothetical protein ACOH2M_31810 [Cypionkella sp.]